MNIEIVERIVKCNKTYYANEKLIKSKFLKRSTKIEIYKMIIRPVVTYSSETWILTTKDDNKLRILKSKYYGKYLVLFILIIHG
jgi:hypothetical protein